MVKLNGRKRNGSWNLSSDYLKYRVDGGVMAPDLWNKRQKELARENGVCIDCGKPAFSGIICSECFHKRLTKKQREIMRDNEETLRTIARVAGE